MKYSTFCYFIVLKVSYSILMKKTNILNGLFMLCCLAGLCGCASATKSESDSVGSVKNENPNRKTGWNDWDVAQYAKCFNDLCVDYKICGFWWDCNQLIYRSRDKLSEKGIAKPEIVKAIMDCYGEDWPVNTGDNSVFEEESAQDAVIKMKTGWNLGNTLDCGSYEAKWDPVEKKYYDNYRREGEQGWIITWGEKKNDKVTTKAFETAWGMRETTREDIHFVKEAGFGAVRVPVTWAEHLDENDNIDPDWMARVHTVIDYVMDEGLYCIVNTHHDSGWIKDQNKYYDQFNGRFKKIWEQISEEFKDYDERLLFASMNEVYAEGSADRTTEAFDVHNKWNQLFVDTVRASGGNNEKRNLVIMSYGGSGSVKDFARLKVPSDKYENHLIFEPHNYNPQGFCFEKAPWTYETARWNFAEFPVQLKRDFIEMKDGIENKLGIPMIIGEYAAFSKKYEDYDK